MPRQKLYRQNQNILSHIDAGLSAFRIMCTEHEMSEEFDTAMDEISSAEAELQTLLDNLHTLSPYELEEFEIDHIEIDDLLPLYQNAYDTVSYATSLVWDFWDLFYDWKTNRQYYDEDEWSDYVESWEERAAEVTDEFEQAVHEAFDALIICEGYLL